MSASVNCGASEVVSDIVEDPTCGRHTIWLAQLAETPQTQFELRHSRL